MSAVAHLTHAAQHIEAAHPGHHNVEHYEIEVALVKQIEAFGATRRRRDRAALPFEHAAKQFAVAGVVVTISRREP